MVAQLTRRSQRSAEAEQYRSLYKTKQWERLRMQVLIRDAFVCQQTGVILKPGRKHPRSAVVHHKKPHKGDPALFFDPHNLEAVSKVWHDQEAQRHERGHVAARDAEGWLVYRPFG